jgi:hypothetical protein
MWVNHIMEAARMGFRYHKASKFTPTALYVLLAFSRLIACSLREDV